MKAYNGSSYGCQQRWSSVPNEIISRPGARPQQARGSSFTGWIWRVWNRSRIPHLLLIDTGIGAPPPRIRSSPHNAKVIASMGDPARVRAWLADIWSPVVMVVASPETDAACLATTGLTVVELLRPFGLIPHLNGTVGGERWVQITTDPVTALHGVMHMCALSADATMPGRPAPRCLGMHCSCARAAPSSQSPSGPLPSTPSDCTPGACGSTPPSTCFSPALWQQTRTCGLC